MWISRKRFKELEEKCNKLEKMKEDIDRVKRIMKHAKSSELTYVDQKCYVYVYDTFCSKNPYYVYLNNNEYEISVPCGQKIYDVKKTKSDNTIIVMCNGEYMYGVVFADKYISELGNELCKLNRELDYIAIVNMSTRSVSYRTIKDDVDMGMISKKYGGGGHPKAAGSKFDVYKLARFLDELS